MSGARMVDSPHQSEDTVEPDDAVSPPTGSAPSADRSLFSGLGDLGRNAARLTGVDGAAIALLTESTGVRDLVRATDAMSYHLDELQFTLGEGPCLDVFSPAGSPQLVPDMGDEVARRRWPVFTAEARAVGVQAVFAFAVTAGTRPLGVLELYRRSAGALTEDEAHVAALCAESVATTIAQNWDAVIAHLGPGSDAAHVAEWLAAGEVVAQGANSRAQVYVASGMVAAQLKIPTTEAMARLRAHAYQTGRSIKDVADDIVTRRLDTRGTFDGTEADR
ncbi:GAF and ANTAR domain-containing protein [Williamsia sp.]|uniref:GAF and ANTAR domain-containing protein n=1 Tax=Williamsia sp. TaxID=1872085 RepID=UPI001A18C963|nr:GAF and ANTAR domain-containing protein [Williamsia sp.]MBJ7288462.1 GAF and ANTAR domain-containing protein [Williamsia sp.]